MNKTEIGKPRGIVNQQTVLSGIQHSQTAPSAELDFFIQHFWSVQWNLPNNETHVAETLPHPNVHLVFEKNKTKISGVHSKKFVRKLEDQGEVFGVKFKSGGFYPFFKKPVSNIANKLIEFEDVFEISSLKLEQEIFSVPTKEEKIKMVETFLTDHLPEKDELIPYLSEIMESINSNRKLIKVEEVCEEFKINKRKLERLFKQYIGVSPKWVIKRYRLHEALEQLKAGNFSDLTGLSFDLGYFDQSHFIKDFRQMIGKSPLEYVKTKV